MLSIGPASSCDICYERFGQDPKAPWSIECGHVFCGECIQNVDDPRLCPMCRSPFEHESCIKLHVDLDLAPGEPSSVEAADIKEARRIQHAIASIPETGATEPSLRQLIQEGNKFLSSQPRNAHKDLRSAHRIIAYLYEVKMQHRAQAQAIDSIKEQASQLTQEKEELQKQLEKLEETRQYESETAAAVENTLREHCAQAKQSQKAASEQLKKLNEENEDLKKQVKFLMGNLTARPVYGPLDQQETYPTYKTIPSSVFDKLDMKSVAIQDPSSFLISPLPQFTSALPAMFDNFAPLPDLAEDDDDAQESTDDEDEEVVTPDSSQQQLRPSESREVRSSQFAPEPDQSSRPPVRGPLEPSGLSRTAPYREHRRERSSSNPVQPTNRSHSPFDSIVTSTIPTPPVQTTGHSTPSRDTYVPPPTHDRDILRSRLQDILSDSSTSSSLPILSSNHFPPSLTRDANAAHKDDHPQAGSSKSTETLVTVAPQQIPISSSSSSQSSSSSSKPPRSTSPNHLVGTRMSSASAEAKKLEDERRRRHREEKYGPDYDRQPTEPDRDTRRYTAPSNLSNIVISSSSASQAARREQQPYGNPLNPNPTSTLKRSSTMNSASYGRSGLGGLQPGQEQGMTPSSRLPYVIPSSKSSPKATVPTNQTTGIYT